MKLMACVPNISEGRDQKTIDTVLEIIDHRKNVWLISTKTDEYYNRSFFSLVGDPDELTKCIFDISDYIIKNIDINGKETHHPRIGAMDVIPFIPLEGMTDEEALKLTESFAKEYSEKFNVPVYLYEKSAKFEKRRNINNIRKVEFEGLKERMESNEWKPDFGEDRPHATAGATIIGVRDPLITIDFYINAGDRWLIDQIKREVQMQVGGNIFIHKHSTKTFIVTVNVSAKEKTIIETYELVKDIAENYGCSIDNVELTTPITHQMAIDAISKYTGGLSNKIITVENEIIKSMMK